MQTTNAMKWWQTLIEARGKNIYEIAGKIQRKFKAEPFMPIPTIPQIDSRSSLELVLEKTA
jgi:hypothetical protein